MKREFDLSQLKKVIAEETNTKDGKLKELNEKGKKKSEEMQKNHEDRKKKLQKNIEDLKT